MQGTKIEQEERPGLARLILELREAVSEKLKERNLDGVLYEQLLDIAIRRETKMGKQPRR